MISQIAQYIPTSEVQVISWRSKTFCGILGADVFKGSFYANPVLDVPTTEKRLIERFE
jgi:hypothetical protein